MSSAPDYLECSSHTCVTWDPQRLDLVEYFDSIIKNGLEILGKCWGSDEGHFSMIFSRHDAVEVHPQWSEQFIEVGADFYLGYDVGECFNLGVKDALNKASSVAGLPFLALSELLFPRLSSDRLRKIVSEITQNCLRFHPASFSQRILKNFAGMCSLEKGNPAWYSTQPERGWEIADRGFFSEFPVSKEFQSSCPSFVPFSHIDVIRELDSVVVEIKHGITLNQKQQPPPWTNPSLMEKDGPIN